MNVHELRLVNNRCFIYHPKKKERNKTSVILFGGTIFLQVCISVSLDGVIKVPSPGSERLCHTRRRGNAVWVKCHGGGVEGSEKKREQGHNTSLCPAAHRTASNSHSRLFVTLIMMKADF